jgi:uncharacterized RmlC-like cupin family protein
MRALALGGSGPDIVSIARDAKTGVDHHGEPESVIYVVTGRARMRWGERLHFVAEAGAGAPLSSCAALCTTPGDQRRSNPVPWNACSWAQTIRPSLVNIMDVEPVETPEEVYWVDPIQRRP